MELSTEPPIIATVSYVTKEPQVQLSRRATENL